MNNITNEIIHTSIVLTDYQKNICEAGFNEIILYYLVNPLLFFSHVYNSLSTMSWKFYF